MAQVIPAHSAPLDAVHTAYKTISLHVGQRALAEWGESWYKVVVLDDRGHGSVVEHPRFDWAGLPGGQTVQFDVLECGPFISTIGSADRQIHRVGAQLIKFVDLLCRTSNSAIESAEREIRCFREQTVKFDDLEYPLSDSSIGSADLQFATSFRSFAFKEPHQ